MRDLLDLRRCVSVIIIFLMMWSPIVSAAALPITRRDGFLLLWQTLRRPAGESRMPFVDMEKSDTGAKEIASAASRNIIKDEQEFRPNDPLFLSTALVWLLRTRNVADPDDITAELLPTLVSTYALNDLVPFDGDQDNRLLRDHPVTEDELTTLMRRLDVFLASADHEVSLYGEKFHGKGTAFGEQFDMNALTAAHRTLPYNTLVRVTNVANGKQVTVRINDRGPYVEGRDMDLSVAAFTAIEDRSKGVLHARFERLGDATVVSACASSSPRQIRITRDTRLIGGVPHVLPLGETVLLRSTRSFVVRDVRYPDGGRMGTEDWILPGEQFAFTPSLPGVYEFVLGSVQGRRRALQMRVQTCNEARQSSQN
jgi:hypothetical protein